MTIQIDIGVERVTDTAKLPVYKHKGDAGADVYADLPDGAVRLEPRDTTMISLGIKVVIPEGWEIQVRSRSGLSLSGVVVANSPGTIDSGFRGICQVILYNSTNKDVFIGHHDRIAQFVLKEAPVARYFNISDIDQSTTTRGANGFGSTGK